LTFCWRNSPPHRFLFPFPPHVVESVSFYADSGPHSFSTVFPVVRELPSLLNFCLSADHRCGGCWAPLPSFFSPPTDYFSNLVVPTCRFLFVFQPTAFGCFAFDCFRPRFPRIALWLFFSFFIFFPPSVFTRCSLFSLFFLFFVWPFCPHLFSYASQTMV